MSGQNFDPAALRARYKAERDKRLRADGDHQYRRPTGVLKEMLDDPHAARSSTRAPIQEETDVLIVGGGFSGLLSGGMLASSGVENIRILEKGSDFGGTWYWNRYPGCACDVESYIYMPLLEETGYIPSEKYAKATEIWEHAQRLGKHFKLYDKAVFQTTVKSLKWDDEANRWLVSTDRGDLFRARFIILGTGTLNRPKLPGIPGIETFKGHRFHTSRWDYNYTGGGPAGNLEKLEDKRVAVIGTGATAIQCVPFVAESAKVLFVFQRTPSSVDARGNRPTDPSWVKSLDAGWQLRRMRNFEAMTTGYPADEDLVQDGWTDIARNLVQMKSDGTGASHEELMQLADFKKMEEIRDRIGTIVKDPRTAESLKPYFNMFCKRPCFSDSYLESFNRQNVTLVDTDGRGVTRITEDAVVVGDTEYKVDCIIFATGFESAAPTYQAGDFELIGRANRTLESKWESGVRTLHGIYVAGFPNMFILLGLRQAGAGFNNTYVISEQSRHVAALIKRSLERGVERFEVTKRAEERWQDVMRSKAILRDTFVRECTPGYYNNEGNLKKETLYQSLYGGGSVEYFDLLEKWRVDGIDSDMEEVRGTP